MGTHRDGLARGELEELVAQGLSVREIGDRLDRTPATVSRWLNEHGLATAPRSAPPVPGGTRAIRICGVHGETTFRRRADGGWRCLRCRSEAVVRRRRKVKAILVAEAGGRCAGCGYDRFVGALEFHHVDPAEKRFTIAGRGIARSLARARAEAAKCVLLCANCHAEVEAGIRQVALPARYDVASDPG